MRGQSILMSDPFRFRQFKVYQDAKRAYLQSVGITRKFPKEYYDLIDQLRRAALSVCLNIAEGSAKQSDRDFRRFILVALGSTNEVVACLDIVIDLLPLMNEEVVHLLRQYEQIGKQLGGLAKKLQVS